MSWFLDALGKIIILISCSVISIFKKFFFLVSILKKENYTKVYFKRNYTLVTRYFESSL